jgi:ATP-dependent 26S proteasome regulatory subunit
MDYILTSFMFSTINKISTGNWLYDIVATLILMMGMNYILNDNNRSNIFSKIGTFIGWQNKYNSITYSASDKEVSNRYRALMHFISHKCDPSVKGLFEVELKKYNPRTDYDEYHTSVYRVSQNKRFNITDTIEGRVYWSSKDKSEYNGKVSYVEYQNLELLSKKLSMKEIISWVDSIEKEYKQYLKSKMLDTQTLVEVSWDARDQCIQAFYVPWESNVTFENRFFTSKNEILNKINFFLHNEKWYKDRGIPYTLGILLWGEPGCGKTGFIKALMNLTKRHGIDIKLSKKMDMNRLREIMCDDEITDDIIIPQNQRILLFEDIDAMGEVVKDRDLPKDSSDIDLDKKISEAIDTSIGRRKRRVGRGDNEEENFSVIPKPEKNDNNNLSFFLNILDGLNECPGRIVIMTTNKPEYLDKALVRPGRIDFKIHMKKATLSDIKEIIQFYWSVDNELDLLPEWSEKLSHAEIVSCCRLSDNYLDTITRIQEFIINAEKEKNKPKSITSVTDSESDNTSEKDSVSSGESKNIEI